MDSTKASVFIYLIPIVAMLVGWAFLGETITFYMVVGFALTIVGIWISGRK
jgi:drug/metabolite transporter (DMT)-like permease